MSGDYSRRTFDPHSDYSGVLQQQGRVQLDSDVNEAHDIYDYRLRAQTMDIMGHERTGRGVVSIHTPRAFEIEWIDDTLVVHPGPIYVDGIRVENHGADPAWDPALAAERGTAPIDFTMQPYYPATELPDEDEHGVYLIYLEVSAREGNHILFPDLLEPALQRAFGRPVDTTLRRQTVWQVKWKEIEGDDALHCGSNIPEWEGIISPSLGRLTTGRSENAVDGEFFNRLYRFEIHKPGDIGTATCKWSMANSTVMFEVDEIESDERIRLRSLEQTDPELGLKKGDLIELLDDRSEFLGELGHMATVEDIASKVITISPAMPNVADFHEEGLDPQLRHLRIKRWEGQFPVTEGPVDIDGIRLTFSADPPYEDAPPSTPTFHTQDYWNCWTRQSGDSNVEALQGVRAHGPHRHYCRLAILDRRRGIPIIKDCRHFFPPKQDSLHIQNVFAEIRDAAGDVVEEVVLENDAVISPATLAGGLRIDCDATLAAESVEDRPVCEVSVDLPFPLVPIREFRIDYRHVLGFQSAKLAGKIHVEGSAIHWEPYEATRNWLSGSEPEAMTIKAIFDMGSVMGWENDLRAHLTVKGSLIWADNPRRYLDGDETGLPGGDFEMWFWIEREEV